MNIKSIAGKEFLVISSFSEKQSLNPFYINIAEIRYLREYVDGDISKRTNKANNPWAVQIGEKMFATDCIEGLNDIKAGDEISIGKFTFLCVMASSLTNKPFSKHLINVNNILYMRKYVDNDPEAKKNAYLPGKQEKNNTFVSKNDENTAEIDKFALITVDNRVIPIENIISGYAEATV